MNPQIHDSADLCVRLERLECAVRRAAAVEDIRRCVNRYMHLCDQLDASTPLDELAALFTRDAVWQGSGARYADSFGGHWGRAAIADMFRIYLTDPPHFRMNAHFLCSEQIVVDDTAQQATASWLMLQTSTFSSGASHLNAARLELRLAYEEGRWRIAHFQTENVFSRPVARWEDDAPLPVPQG